MLDELVWIEANLNVKEVFFEDDTFTISKERVLEFCKGYQERGLSVAWSCNARANTLDLETMQAMKKANCRAYRGYESVDSILQAIKKGITTDRSGSLRRTPGKRGCLCMGISSSGFR